MRVHSPTYLPYNLKKKKKKAKFLEFLYNGKIANHEKKKHLRQIFFKINAVKKTMGKGLGYEKGRGQE